MYNECDKECINIDLLNISNRHFFDIENKITVIEFENINKIKNDIDINNRFFNIFKIKNYFEHNLCELIIDESEKYAKENGGWQKKRHSKYPTTDLPLSLIETINPKVRYILYKALLPKIKKLYKLNGAIIYGADIFVVKYKYDEQNELEMHCDGSVISFNILLNEQSEFVGGGTEFEDGTILKIDKGDVVIHCGKIKHSGKKIETGTRYLLVGFLNIKII